MSRCRLALLAVALWVACATGPAEEAGAPGSLPGRGAGHHELTRQNAFLYEVSRPGSDRVDLYVLGSLHALDVPLRLGSGLQANLESSDALVLEIDPASMDLETMGAAMLRYGLLEYGEQLDQMLTSSTWALLSARLAQPDFRPEERMAAQRMRPWAISFMLLEKQMAQAGVDPSYGVDFFFVAQRGGKPILELESVDEQLFAMASLSDAEADALLRQALEQEASSSDGGAGELARLIAAWKSGDADRLAAVMFERAEEFPELHEAVFVARNERMAFTLVDLLEEDPERVLFTVIGAGHVIGDEGVPAMLGAEGYTVRRAR